MPFRFQIITVLGGPMLALLASQLAAQNPANAKPLIRVGVIDSLFEHKDEKSTLAQMQPFSEMIKQRTGMNGEFTIVKGADTLGRDMNAGKVHLGVVHGIEYGWLRQHCPECRPLLVAVNETTHLKALVLVAQNDAGKTAADLKGQTLALPPRPPHHTRLFLERLVKEDLGKFFKVTEVKNTDAAIEAVIDGTARLTVVSNVAMEVYRNQKPGRFAKLRVLEESPTFPAAAVVYRPGKGHEESLRQFRDSLLKANQGLEGRQMLTLWRLTGFEQVPKEYEKQVEEIVKIYPP